MISIANNSIKQTLNQYLIQYRPAFKKRSFLVFSWLITAIICNEEVRSIKFLYDNFIQKYCSKALNCFYYFLSYANFSCSLLLIITVKIALSLIPDELKPYTTIFLSTDDTFQEKFRNKFDCYSKLFDHTSKNGSNYLNGHCFVSLVINIPLFWNGGVKYLNIPIGYRLYDKQKTKLEIASSMIDTVIPLLTDYQVILLCDNWYSKGIIIESVKKYDNLELIAAVRCDTVLYDLPPAPTGKRGRPRKYGNQLDIKNFRYEKVGDYYIATKKVLSNLFETKPVTVIVTVKNLESFASIRVFISTITADDINVFKKHQVVGVSSEPEKFKYLPYLCYHLRWNIEVIFYQHKFFWSFGNYMVRNQKAIERYVNLLAIAFAFMQVLPFIHQKYDKYKFQSPQVVKRVVSDQLTKELIFESFVTKLETHKNYSIVRKAVYTFLGLEDVA